MTTKILQHYSIHETTKDCSQISQNTYVPDVRGVSGFTWNEARAVLCNFIDGKGYKKDGKWTLSVKARLVPKKWKYSESVLELRINYTTKCKNFLLKEFFKIIQNGWSHWHHIGILD